MKVSQNSSPSLLAWKELYQAAIKFKEINCWDWMWDTDIFGVQNPLNKEIGYCTIMGRAKAHFGLGVYLESEGLKILEEIFSGKASPKKEDNEILFRQR